jgi:hypothetical protein
MSKGTTNYTAGKKNYPLLRNHLLDGLAGQT